MCNRIKQTKTSKQLSYLLNMPVINSPDIGDSLSIGSDIPVITSDHKIDSMKWSNMYNKRSERVKELENPLVVITEGFFEKKHFFSDGLTLLAGVEMTDGVSILTQQSMGNVKEVHHRMPVIIDRNEIDQYLQEKIIPIAAGDNKYAVA